jgi:hypothetical protein
MKPTASITHVFPRSHSESSVAAVLLIFFRLALAAQEPTRSGIDVQREAMQKLAFLAGQWSGPVTIDRGTGEPLHHTQS